MMTLNIGVNRIRGKIAAHLLPLPLYEKAINMIDLTTNKQIVAVRKGNQITIELYSWADIYRLEEYIDQKLGIEIDSFKPIKDESGNEIGCELIFDEFQDIELLQSTIDKLE